MDTIKQRILSEGRVLPGNILRVDSFLNHQVDSALMALIGREFARRFGTLQPTKVLTAETAGIAPALQTGVALDVPVLFARRARSVTMHPAAYERRVSSRTKGGEMSLLISPEFLGPGDRVIIIDDFLATGQTIRALASITKEARAELLAVGVVIEKSFEQGRKNLVDLGVPIVALATVVSMDGGHLVLAEEG